MKKFTARQPIFTTGKDVLGYPALFRPEQRTILPAWSFSPPRRSGPGGVGIGHLSALRDALAAACFGAGDSLPSAEMILKARESPRGRFPSSHQSRVELDFDVALSSND
jgi:hypothetical protein